MGHDIERQPARPPGNPAFIHSPDELTDEWLTVALRSTGALWEGEVSTLAREDLGRGRTGRLARIRPRYRGPADGAPTSLIAKFPGAPGPVRDLVLRFGLYEREVSFYRALAPRAGIRAPALIYADSNASGETVLLLEDVAPSVEGDLSRGASVQQVTVILEHLAAMHARWWADPALDSFAWLPARNNPQTIALSASVPSRAWKDFVKANASWLSPSAAVLVSRLEGDRSVLDRLSQPPLTLVHGDTRVNNVMFSAGDGVTLRAVVDWQSVMRARPGVDIACLLVNSLSPRERRSAESDLLPAYHRTLAAGGVVGYSLADLWTDYRLEILNELNQVVVWSSLGVGAGGGTTTVARLFAAVDELELADLLAPPARRVGWARRALPKFHKAAH